MQEVEIIKWTMECPVFISPISLWPNYFNKSLHQGQSSHLWELSTSKAFFYSSVPTRMQRLSDLDHSVDQQLIKACLLTPTR